MAWQDPILEGFQGLNSFFGQVTPVLIPIIVTLFIGVTFIMIGRRVVLAVTT